MTGEAQETTAQEVTATPIQGTYSSEPPTQADLS